LQSTTSFQIDFSKFWAMVAAKFLMAANGPFSGFGALLLTILKSKQSGSFFT
jgi:hypothetical protein